MHYIFDVLLAIVAEVTAHYICKWLDSKDKTLKLAQHRQKAPMELQFLRGFGVFAHYIFVSSL